MGRQDFAHSGSINQCDYLINWWTETRIISSELSETIHWFCKNLNSCFSVPIFIGHSVFPIVAPLPFFFLFLFPFLLSFILSSLFAYQIKQFALERSVCIMFEFQLQSEIDRRNVIWRLFAVVINRHNRNDVTSTCLYPQPGTLPSPLPNTLLKNALLLKEVNWYIWRRHTFKDLVFIFICLELICF